MNRFLKAVALLLAVCCLVWLAVLWYWDRTHHDMSTLDIVWYLMVLPVTIFGLLILGKWALGAANTKAEQREAERAKKSEANPSHPAEGMSPASAQQAVQRRAFALLSTHASTPAGLAGNAALGDLVAAVKAGDCRPGPDQTLTGEDGLPVLCARIPDLDTAELEPVFQACMDQAIATQTAGANSADREEIERLPAHADEATLRAIAALAPALAASLEDIRLHEPALNAEPAKATPAQSAQRASRPGANAGFQQPSPKTQPSAPCLRVAWVWPQSFTARERIAADLWLRQQVSQATADWLKPDRLKWAGSASPDASTLWRDAEVFDNLSGDTLASTPRRGSLQLLLACHSDLSPQAIEVGERAGNLHGAQRPAAQFASESAIALTLASPGWPVLEDNPPLCHLSRSNAVRREKPIDSSGRVSTASIDLVASQLLEATGLKPADVGAVASDADQHTNRSKEYFGSLIGQFGHLDAVDDSTVLGAALGRLGPAAPLLTTAVAGHLAKTSDCTCLALSLDDPLQRFAVLATPLPPASPSA